MQLWGSRYQRGTTSNRCLVFLVKCLLKPDSCCYGITIRDLLICRHVVPSSHCLWILPASDTSLDCYCTSVSRYQTGPAVWLVSCHLSDVHQQVSQHLPQRPDPKERIDLSRPARLTPFCPLPSVGGLILDTTVSNPDYEGMAVFTPVINGAEILLRMEEESVFDECLL